MITPWPGISRGTLWTVPIVPGLVSEIDAPWKSSTVSLFDFTRRMRSSYAARKPAKSSVSASRMIGVTSVRWPLPLSTSTARARLTCSRCTSRGRPSAPVTNSLFIAGTSSAIARTMA